MKRMLLIMLATLSTALCSASMDAISLSKVRKETRFLTDKMAYELNLTIDQYNDVYEINFDFIFNSRNVMDHVLYGYEWALDTYYDYLDMRNDDLRWVLSYSQYNKFMRAEYFYRPIYTSGSSWSFRIYTRYANHSHYYFPRPYHYRSYTGGHCRTYHNNVSYYRGRHNVQHYSSNDYLIRSNRTYSTARQTDFSSVNVRSNTNQRPANINLNTTRRNNSSNSGTRSNSTSGTRTDNNNKATTNGTRTTNSSGSRSSNTNSSGSRSTNNSSTSRSNSGSSSGSRSNSSSNSNSSRSSSSDANSRTNSSSRSTTNKSNVDSSKGSSSSVRSSSGSSSTRSSGSSSTRSSSGSSSSRRSAGGSR